MGGWCSALGTVKLLDFYRVYSILTAHNFCYIVFTLIALPKQYKDRTPHTTIFFLRYDFCVPVYEQHPPFGGSSLPPQKVRFIRRETRMVHVCFKWEVSPVASVCVLLVIAALSISQTKQTKALKVWIISLV